jgi:hypothetical protein
MLSRNTRLRGGTADAGSPMIVSGLRGLRFATSSARFFREAAESSVDDGGSPFLRAVFARVSGAWVVVFVIHRGLRENVFVEVF